MTLALRFAVRSDVGLLREGNEDSAFAGPHLLAIADGMGGHAAGEVASAVAIGTLTRLAGEVPAAGMLESLADAVATANRALHDMSAADPAVEGMGTTLTVLLWSGQRVAVCHIGDSRAYLLRGGDFQQITRDHTLVQALVDDGRISRDEASTHPQRSLLLRALDGSADAEPDLSVREAKVGDRYLLCSDGLTDVVSDSLIHRTLAVIDDPDLAVRKLIELAIQGGGPDNITCIVADVVDSADSRYPPTEASRLVGAASSANGTGPGSHRADGVAGKSQALFPDGGRVSTLTSPAHAAVPRPAAGPGTAPSVAHQAPAGMEDEEEARLRRRWPIMSSVLAVVLILIVGGGYAGWRYTQDQFYVGESGGEVAIFRGINQDLAGMRLFSVYHRTGIPVSGVPTTDLAPIRATITAGGLADAQRIVANIRSGYQRCQQSLAQQAAYQKDYASYRNLLAAYQKLHHTTKPVTDKGKHYTPPVPPKQPAPLPPECPAPAPSGSATPATPGGGSTP